MEIRSPENAKVLRALFCSGLLVAPPALYYPHPYSPIYVEVNFLKLDPRVRFDRTMPLSVKSMNSRLVRDA